MDGFEQFRVQNEKGGTEAARRWGDAPALVRLALRVGVAARLRIGDQCARREDRGCGQEDLKASGGDGLFYCFLAQ